MTVKINGTTGLATDSASAVVETVSLNHPSSATAAITLDASDNVTLAGDLSVDTDTLYVDSTNNWVGIGTSSPSRLVHLSGSGANTRLRVENTTGSNVLDIYAEDGGNSTLNYSSVLTMSESGTERMRIDSSGNLLVGKTSASTSVAGVGLFDSGLGTFTRASAQPLDLNRTSSDGSILEFRKDNTSVGSIGVLSSRMMIGTDDVGLFFDSITDNAVEPSHSTTGPNDGVIDLGSSGARFKDFYLSGGVYLGGTGSDNKLDDYEEGTFTPTLFGTSATGTATYGIQAGSYTKVGDQVTVWILLTATALTSASGSMAIGNLPFSCAVAGTGTVMVEDLNWSGTGTYLVTYMSAGTTYLRIFQCRDNGSWQAQNPTNAAQGYYITHTYKTS